MAPRAIPASRRAKTFRLGLYGGTFDPVHYGHLISARDALEQGRLDAVAWIPCALSPHKKKGAQAGDADRLLMLRLALRGQEGFWISESELRRPAPSYAIDTVLEFRAALPGAKFFFLIGADQIPRLATWKRFPELRRLVTFLVLDRPTGSPRRLPPGVISLPRPRWVDISATEIRARVKQSRSIDFLVPPPVAAHIARRGLYR